MRNKKWYWSNMSIPLQLFCQGSKAGQLSRKILISNKIVIQAIVFRTKIHISRAKEIKNRADKKIKNIQYRPGTARYRILEVG
jgi:hypothetical protein